MSNYELDDFEINTLKAMTKHACEEKCPLKEEGCLKRDCFVYEVKDIIKEYEEKKIDEKYLNVLLHKMADYFRHNDDFHETIKERDVCGVCAMSEVIEKGEINTFWLDMIIEYLDFGDDEEEREDD